MPANSIFTPARSASADHSTSDAWLPAIGPRCCRSEGAEFTSDYLLYARGLLAPPRLLHGA